MIMLDIFVDELKKVALTEGLMQRAQLPAYHEMVSSQAGSPRAKRMIDLLSGIAVRRAGVPKSYRP
jgi:hypothetical protein